MGLFSSIGSVLGGAVGGPVGSAIGGAIGAGLESKSASKGASSASSAAAAAREETLRSAQEGVDVAREFIDDFEAIYGGLEDNLSSFFSSLTPERFTALGLEAFQKEFQTTKTKINESFAQRGIPDSGLEISLDTLLEAKGAETRAGIRTDAPFKVAEAQSKFLALGLPQKAVANQQFLSALQDRTNILGGFAAGSTQAAQQAAAGAGVAQGEFGAALEPLGKIAGDFLGGILNPSADTVA